MRKKALQGQTVLITGAAGGIGNAAAELFAEEGANLVLSDIDHATLGNVTNALRKKRRKVVSLAGDLTSEKYCEELIGLAVDTYNKLDVLYNNAGTMVGGEFFNVEEVDIHRAMAVNVSAQIILSKYAALAMSRSGGGSIVNTSSMGGYLGYGGMTAYTASKAAMIGATKTMAIELAEHNIRVNVIVPGIVDTRMPNSFLRELGEEQREAVKQTFFSRQIMKRFGKPEEIAAAALFLASPAASFITGLVMPVDGGWSAW